MAIEIVTTEDLEKFRLKLIEDIKNIVKPSGSIQKEWIKSDEVRKLLGISPGTLQQFRINGNLPYSKIGGIIFYKYSDVMDALERKKRPVY